MITNREARKGPEGGQCPEHLVTQHIGMEPQRLLLSQTSLVVIPGQADDSAMLLQPEP